MHAGDTANDPSSAVPLQRLRDGARPALQPVQSACAGRRRDQPPAGAVLGDPLAIAAIHDGTPPVFMGQMPGGGTSPQPGLLDAGRARAMPLSACRAGADLWWIAVRDGHLRSIIRAFAAAPQQRRHAEDLAPVAAVGVFAGDVGALFHKVYLDFCAPMIRKWGGHLSFATRRILTSATSIGPTIRK